MPPKTGRHSIAAEAPASLPIIDDAGISPRMRLTINLVMAARRWRSLLDDRLRLIGQSSARMEALWAIAHTPSSPQIEIAKRIGIEGATLTRMLDTLETEGLVERVRDPSDRRSKHIRITASGEAALAEIVGMADELRARLVQGISDPAIDEANDFLADVLRRLDAMPQAS